MLIANLNKVRELSWRERGLLVESVVLLPLIHVALMLLGFARLQRFMEWLKPLKADRGSIPSTGVLPYARQLARIVAIAAGHGLYRATCLRRSMLLWWFLRRDGIQSHICFGVRMTGRVLSAHAWLEWDGIVLNDASDISEHFKTLQAGLPATTLGL